MYEKSLTIECSTDGGTTWLPHSIIDWPNVPDGTPDGPTQATSADEYFPWALDKTIESEKAWPYIGFHGKQILRYDDVTGKWYHYKAYGHDWNNGVAISDSYTYPKVDGGGRYPFTFISGSGNYTVPASEYEGQTIY